MLNMHFLENTVEQILNYPTRTENKASKVSKSSKKNENPIWKLQPIVVNYHCSLIQLYCVILRIAHRQIVDRQLYCLSNFLQFVS